VPYSSYIYTMNLRGGSGKLPAKLCHLRVTAFDQRTDDQRTTIFATVADLALPPATGASHPDRDQ
jgi:hypothetical protein